MSRSAKVGAYCTRAPASCGARGTPHHQRPWAMMLCTWDGVSWVGGHVPRPQSSQMTLSPLLQLGSPPYSGPAPCIPTLASG